ncbi:Lnb N-terminal periplasmic domain-containing protein [Helicobacter monodelphidis]|uniref:Lnb N-terminal periplasmic domain-containing protein n=1 Tax=Helicobacter sp. 15-1451 TaxID=2004995 RepID=UPI0015EBB592|nr:DUF4105 domain-containing protein [Helicobacter sp. 15-1451]
MRYLIILVFFSIVYAETSLQQAITSALDEKLYEKPHWRTLLHYVGNESQIDDSEFFLSTEGKNNPKEEMIATLKAFYIPPKRGVLKPEYNLIRKPSTHPYDTHAICRYPARLRFLNSWLSLQNLPEIECYEFNAMFQYVNPTSISIVFPAAHINSPASMFGHTFLLFDSEFESRLLTHAINYAADADADTENGILFAFKGLFGMYNGKYSILPYYDALKEYRDTESRDIWEFKLNFSRLETKKIFEHLWEVRTTFSDYYFFDENCSYNILWLLESGREELRLRDEFFYQVNPPETLFAFQKNNLILEEIYRPSKRLVIKEYEKQFNTKELSSMREIALGKKTIESIPPLNQDSLKLFLEGGMELSEYYHIASKISKEEYIDIVHSLGKERAKLGKGEHLKPRTKLSPLYGHRAIRVAPTFFAQKESGKLNLRGGIEARLAYHDSSDFQKGFLEGTEIEFLRLALSYGGLQKEARLEDLRFLNISSIAPISALFQPFSYRVRLGADRSFLHSTLSPYMGVGFGYAYEPIDSLLLYAMVEPYIFYDQYQKGLVSLHGTLGTLIGGESLLRFVGEYQYRLYPYGVMGQTLESQINLAFTPNLSLLVGYSHLFFNDSLYPQRGAAKVGIRFYF